MALSLFPLCLLKMFSGRWCSRAAQEREKKSHFNNSAPPPPKTEEWLLVEQKQHPNLGCPGIPGPGQREEAAQSSASRGELKKGRGLGRPLGSVGAERLQKPASQPPPAGVLSLQHPLLTPRRILPGTQRSSQAHEKFIKTFAPRKCPRGIGGCSVEEG